MPKFPKPVKVFDLSGDMLMRGLTVNKAGFQGGIFRQAANFDPFDVYEVIKGSPQAQERGSGTITGTPKQLLGFQSGGTRYAYAFADSSKLYKVTTGTGSVSDISAQITGITTFRGAEFYKNKVLYSADAKIVSNDIDPVLANQADIVTGLETANHVMCVGPDKLMYFLNLYKIGRITNVAGTSGNSDNVFAFDSNVILRDIDHDGQLLIVVGDTNTLSPSLGRSRCFVAFWNMASGNLTQLYEIRDESYIAGVAVDGDDVIVFGKENYYLCNSVSKPQPLLPIANSNNNITTAPVTPWAIINRRGSILWADGTNDGIIFAYGSPKPSVIPKAFHSPFTTGAQPQCLLWNGDALYAGCSGSHLYSNDSTTKDSAVIIIPQVKLKRFYTFAYAIVMLRGVLGSGGSVELQLGCKDGNGVLLNDSTLGYSTVGAKHQLFFYPNFAGTANDCPVFSEIEVQLFQIYGSTEVVSLEIYGIPTLTGPQE